MILFLSMLGCFSRMVVGVVAPQVETALNSAEDTAWEVLYSGAESLDVSVRLLSAHELVRYRPEPSGGEYTQRFLLDPSPYVKRAALNALIERFETGEDPAALALLLESLHQEDIDPYTWGHLAHSLIGLVDEGDTNLIGGKWESESAPYRVLPLAMVAAETGNTLAQTALEAAISAADIPLELTFFDDCGESGLAISSTLMASYEMFEEVLHIPALVCALELGDESAESVLSAMIRSVSSPERALEVLDFVIEADTSAADGAAYRLLSQARESENQVVAAYGRGALLSFGEGEPEVVIEMLGSPDREIRVVALTTLSMWWDRLGHTSSRRQRVDFHDSMLALLSDPNIVVVLSAVDAIGHFAFPEDEAVLSGLLQDDDSMVRVRAASSLLRLRRRAISWEE